MELPRTLAQVEATNCVPIQRQRRMDDVLIDQNDVPLRTADLIRSKRKSNYRSRGVLQEICIDQQQAIERSAFTALEFNRIRYLSRIGSIAKFIAAIFGTLALRRKEARK